MEIHVVVVYVDSLRPTIPSKRWPFRWSCHLYADDDEELYLFADKLGLKQEWFQNPGNYPHYDLVSTKRTYAVSLGAVQHTQREAARYWESRRFM